MHSLILRFALPLALLALPACPIPEKVGDNPVETTSAGETTSDLPGTTAPDPTGTGGPPAAACDTPEPGTRADFTLDLGDFPGIDQGSVDLELDCAVAAVTTGATIETDLTCLDGEGMTHAIDFDVAASEVGPPVWKAGEDVALEVHGAEDYGGLLEATGAGPLIVVEVTMRRAGDGALYASATVGPVLTPDLYSPLKIELDREACGTDLPMEHPNFPGGDRDMAIGFEVGDSSLELFTGQRGSLAVGPGVALAIDVDEATAIPCCHGDWYVFISRRVELE